MGLAGMAAQAAGPLHVGYGGASELSNDKAAGPRPQPLGANLPGYAVISGGGMFASDRAQDKPEAVPDLAKKTGPRPGPEATWT